MSNRWIKNIIFMNCNCNEIQNYFNHIEEIRSKYNIELIYTY